MSHTLKVATVQMDAAPAPVTDRLDRAARLIAEAAQNGAQLIVFPEVFNTGYEYTDSNYGLAEPIDGQTMTWMKVQAAEHHVHLAGSFLLLDAEEIYNSAFIVAPDGRTWRYDKIYPFNWERAYFREGRGTTIADTELGKLGMLICWDAAHADLWQRYAGRVDAMVVTSCPPAFHKSTLLFPDGERRQTIMRNESHFQDQDIEDQAGWLHVPVIASQGTGTFRSHLPLPQLSIAALLGTQPAHLPELLTKLSDANQVWLEADYAQYGKIMDAQGQVVAKIVQPGDQYVIAGITLADQPSDPIAPQPRMRTSPLGFLASDALVTNSVISLYRRGVRRQWGKHMAPFDPRTRVWTSVVIGAAAIGALAGFLAGKTRTGSDGEITLWHG